MAIKAASLLFFSGLFLPLLIIFGDLVSRQCYLLRRSQPP
jgi:hypothetical protein